MIKNSRGFSLLEMMIAIALSGFLATVGYNLYQFATKETAVLSEDIMVTIARFGASRILTRDLSGAEPSFNYINLDDDNGLPFFTLAKNEYCRQEKCSRQLTLELKTGQTKSRSIYFIVKKSIGKETQRLSISPRHVFKPDKSFGGINWQHGSDEYSISKSKVPESPWEPNRIVMLSSEIEFFDCNTTVLKMNNPGACSISCSVSGTCNYAVKRPLKMLGVVDRAPSADMIFHPIKGDASLLATKYNICRPDKDLNCIGKIDISEGIHSTKTFYENLPYIPGTDPRTIVSPVEIVEYYLERPTPQSHDHLIELKRTTASLNGSSLQFGKSLTLMSGIKSVVFNRTNVSAPVIEYKLRKVRMRKSLK